jgi:hypothetical protein
MPLEAEFTPRPAKVAGRVYPSDRPRVNYAFSIMFSAACFQRRQLWRGPALRWHPCTGGGPPPSWIPAFAGTCPDALCRDGHSHPLWAATTILYWVWKGPGTLIRSARVWPRSVIRARV